MCNSALRTVIWTALLLHCAVALAHYETVRRISRPAGSTTVHEFRHKPNNAPYRLRYEHAFSGPLAGRGLDLVFTQQGTWLVRPARGKPFVLLDVAAVQYGQKFRFAHKGSVWTIRANGHAMPTVQEGIATEAEPSIDIELERL